MAQEKMVPLDVTGNPVEVTLKDEDIKEDVPVEESNIREIVEEETPQEVETKEVEETEEVEEAPQEEEADPYKTDDLQDYSKGVKKRINNLVGRMREMERAYKDVQQENVDLKKKYTNVGKGYVSEYEGRVTNAAEAAKAKLKKAIEDNDTEGQVAAQEALAQAKADATRLGTMKQAQQNDEKIYSAQAPQTQETQAEIPQPIDTRAEEWASQNEWFGNDEIMTGAAMALHNRLVTQEAFDPTSDEYYNEINSRMRTEFPQKFSNGKAPEEKKTETKQPVQTVASAVRKTKSGRRVVKLTPSQIAIAKRLNVPLEEYAKYVKE
tara:strand:+ start:1775 stop:2743 length:969 start_codon:yes stop_codon:yes gene_type:complete